jgi:hypothetical protein
LEKVLAGSASLADWRKSKRLEDGSESKGSLLRDARSITGPESQAATVVVGRTSRRQQNSDMQQKVVIVTGAIVEAAIVMNL